MAWLAFVASMPHEIAYVTRLVVDQLRWLVRR